MQEIKPNPMQPAQPTSTVSPKNPSLFLRKAIAKEAEAEQLLHPQPLVVDPVTDGLNTGKLTKFIHYIRYGVPMLFLAGSLYTQIM